jgi:tRNA A-37 threonylcarbamoyl transferase component Bud32
VETTPFVFAGFRGEVARGCEPAGDLADLVRRLADPAAAEATVHWGRNYLYRARYAGRRGPLDVVVKQFNNRGFKARTLRRLRGSKAARAWRAARAFVAAGIDTAEPALLIESERADGPSFFVSRHLGEVVEARYLFRAVQAGREREDFPGIDYPAFMDDLGRLLARVHGAGLFHRDLSIGNVLIARDDPHRLYLVDLNRARVRRRLGAFARTRDLCRLAIFRRADQRRFLAAYWGGEPGAAHVALYRLFHHGFRFKIESKKRWRRLTGRLAGALRPRRAHAHIPEAAAGASARDKIVWDPLSDQPHQHAGRWTKTRERLADLPSHARQTALALTALPAVLARYRELRRRLYGAPVPWDGVGVCARPFPEAPEALLAALDDLGVRKVLLRLHPWADDDRHELELARELHGRGYDLAFALPQNRDLVRDRERWASRVEELGEFFAPYGRHFQVGQAINRSKWGVWTLGEYAELAASAAQVLRRHEGVEILGPAVIDFEVHATMAALRLCRGVGFDALASLLYVDRRGAPENHQLGFDTPGKVTLLQAIAETSPGVSPRSWITEVNWPLWEGPHSPAGRSVSVDEDTQADYLARFYLLALTTHMVERVYWWQAIARGYGLVAPGEGGQAPRRRPSFQALATLERELRGTTCLGPLPAPPSAWLFLFRHDDGTERVAGWCARGRAEATLPRPAVAVVEQHGEAAPGAGPRVELGSSVRYFRLE